jgi:predicted kinase
MAHTRREWTMVFRACHSAGTHDPAKPTGAFDFDSAYRLRPDQGPPEELMLCFLGGLSKSFNLLIVTNRPPGRPLAEVYDFIERLDAITEGRVTIYAPFTQDRCWKPHTGAWEHYVSRVCGGTPPWYAFYCGDAAGRPGDRSAADYAFALNAGIGFTTPEALFFSSDPWADPASYGCSAPSLVALCAAAGLDAGAQRPPLPGLEDAPQRRTCIIFVGSPGSGKSWLVAKYRRAKWIVASRDDLKGQFPKRLAEILARGDNVVVDGTNPEKEDRADLAVPARDIGYSVHLVHVTTPKAICFHLDGARCQLSEREEELPAVAIHTYWKRLEPPTEAEAAEYGGTLTVVPFVLDPARAVPAITQLSYA